MALNERRGDSGVSKRPRLRGASRSMKKGSSNAHSSSVTSLVYWRSIRLKVVHLKFPSCDYHKYAEGQALHNVVAEEMLV